MAKLTEHIRQEILAKYKAGKSQNQLSREYNLSPATINKICKGIPQENISVVNDKVAVDTTIASKSEYEQKAIIQAADEKTKYLIYFQKSALANQKKADEFLERAEDIGTLEAHSRITARNKETILGKTPETVINNNNTQQQIKTNELDLSNLTDEELITLNEILKKTN